MFSRIFLLYSSRSLLASSTAKGDTFSSEKKFTGAPVEASKSESAMKVKQEGTQARVFARLFN